MGLIAGTKLGRYEIRAKIGEGGMGEVYLAQDTKLDRKVALKVLPSDVAADRGRMSRFVQEAKAASALNHPNIITIYEIDQADEIHFIATEFIDGETLRRRMKSAPMRLGDVLDITAQIASALSAAHAAGIVHRDIKPENIMLRPDGIVKVLDFGLAKLTERLPPESIDTEVSTSFKTDPGTVVGTAVYMSPEQVRGLEVDVRTDIFSLGVLIYEMVAGRLPFEGSNTNEIMASILSDKESQPLARYAREVPAELERIVDKALRKNREERYQGIKDLALDVKSLKTQSDFEAKLERSIPPETRGGPATVSGASLTASRQAAPTAPVTESLAGRIKHHRRGLVIALAVLVAAAGLAYWFYSARPATRTSPIGSIVVLPLVNASNDPNTEYLSDGISEALINSLTELQQLRVIARSTAFRYKGKEIDPQAVGRELNVRAVLMGRVRQTGETLNIQVDLVDASTGAQLWGQEYERKVSDVLAIKQTIAREVTEKLRLRLSGEDQRRLVKRDTTSAEAYQFYLRGRYFWNKRTADGLKKAIEQFQQAIDRDPNYALGYVGLADCYVVLEQYGNVPSSESLPKARAFVDRALQLDDSLGEAHASSAIIYQNQWRWVEAEEEFKRAINLNPNYPTAHHWFSQYFRLKRQFDDSMREAKRAQELDPLSLIISQNVAVEYLLKNDLNSAIEECKRMIELDSRYSGAREKLGWAYFKQRRYEEATAEFQKAVELWKSSRHLGSLGYCYAVAGRRAEAFAILKELEEMYARREAIGQHLASVYAGLGDKDQAFAWLERDFQQRSGDLSTITWWHSFDDLRSDPRYAYLVRRMGLQP
ncbi:MAG: eukaryotic-like serine/threonine-protein kinase [Blastocatellia bacterium]|jgi:serine/threonine protein kinase/tetratricopeptide (TPR) repeat protein|nr:eukaryotic-like serine/threonine-protein kinase [Blastocatellia bacterium]